MDIRVLNSIDIKKVVELWYETSVLAHNFISPDYWEENKDAMANVYLPNSETYLAIKENAIVGFISMTDNYLAALFVKTDMQGNGIGKKLLNYIKERRDTIQLKVYKKNARSIQFYEIQDFKTLSESNDENTNEIENLMEWNKNGSSKNEY